MLRITLTTPDGKTRKLACGNSTFSVGSRPDNFVVLHGWKIARVQFTVEERDDGVYLHDATGGGATHVNGAAVADYGPLCESDRIEVGEYKLAISSDHTAPAVAGGAAAAATSTALPHAQPVAAPAAAPAQTAQPVRPRDPVQQQGAEWRSWRSRLHTALLRELDLKRLDVARMSEAELRRNVKGMIEQILPRLDGLPEGPDRDRLAKEVLDEAVGLGPIEDLLADETVTEIMVNRHDEIFVERHGLLERTPISFTDDRAVRSVIERIVTPLGRRIDESSPMVDARLPDGSRVNAIIPPLAIKGSSVTIRKFAKTRLTAEDLIRFGALSEPMCRFLKIAVEQRRSILISGGTGSGKTTLLNVLSNYIPSHERVVTIEDSAELQIAQENLVSLEARPANSEGKGQVPIRDLVKNSLRMRPDRIVVGECRGGEALDMLQAMNTGHDGSLTTVHANAPRDALARVETMVLMAGVDMPIPAIREQIASAIHLIVQQSRYSDGSRKVTYISEVTGVESGTIQLQDLFAFRQRGYDANKRVQGEFVATGAIPEFYENLSARGIESDLSLFTQPK
ncbi:MAG TPA: ATPase, T2SS/T4P/T4SS family [Burkholderiales bacterium]|nr:ATPase, T2SS/T4P/T4SS family [Burkholderiales bacterium]